MKRRRSGCWTRSRKAGAEEALIHFNGLSPQMVAALVADGVKTLEEFATMADWELAGGYTEGPDGKRVKDDGVLERFDVTLEEAQNLIMSARVALGMVDPDALMDLIEDEQDADGEATSDEEADAGAEAADGEALEEETAGDAATADFDEVNLEDLSPEELDALLAATEAERAKLEG